MYVAAFRRGSWLAGLTALALVLPAGMARAQEAPLKFGKLDAREAAVLLAQPTPDSAAAEVLCDFGQSRIKGRQDGFELQFERTARLLIRRSEGYDQATVRVVLYHDKDGGREKINQLKGFTYNLAGTQLSKEPLKTEAVFSRKLDEHHDEYAFTLPNVRAGAIIEFTYQLTSPYLFNLQDWQFQHDIPVRWSEYRVAIPSFYQYKELTRTYLPFAVNDTGVEPYNTSYRQSLDMGYGRSELNTNTLTLTTKALTRRWVLKDAPAFRPDTHMTTRHDYVSGVDFELERIQFDLERPPQFQVGTWAQIETQLLKHDDFGVFLEQSSPLKATAAALATLPDPVVRAKAVRQLLLGAVVYNNTATLYASAAPRKVLELRQGNAADLNLLLVALLRQAGLDAQPLLLSTRGHGRIQTDLPVLSQFNYAVAHVALPDGKELLLDATDASLPAGLLPENCLNDQGRLLGPKGRWVSLAPAVGRFVYTQARLALAPTGELQGTIRQEYLGYAAAERRQPVAALRQQWQTAHPDWVLGPAAAPAAPTASTAESPVALDLQARLPGAEAPAATIYLRPLQVLGELSHPFRSATRLYPVDFAALPRLEQKVELTLPPGYAATALPASVQLALPDNGGRFVFHAAPDGPGKLVLVSRLQLTKPRYSAQEYEALREFYTQALAKMAEPIVLQKQ